MSKKIFKGKIRWRSVISVILVVAIVLGACGAIVSFARSDTNTIGAGAFTRGALNEADGTYVKGKTSIVTEDLFECKGLKVIPDFDNTAQYQVFWYNEDEIYLGATDMMGASTKMVGSVPGAAVYARVVIYPSKTDEDGKAIKDFEIKLWEISKYKSGIKIEVARDQAALQQNLFADTVRYNSGMGTKVEVFLAQENIYVEGISMASPANGLNVSSSLGEDKDRDLLRLDCSSVKVYKLDLSESTTRVGVYLFDEAGKFISNQGFTGDIAYIDLTGANTIVAQIVVETIDGNAVLSEYLYRELL